MGLEPIKSINQIIPRTKMEKLDMSGVFEHISGVSGFMIGCPNLDPDYMDIYPEYPNYQAEPGVFNLQFQSLLMTSN